MGRLGCHTKGGNWRRGFRCKTKSLNFSILLDITPTKKLGPLVPLLITNHIFEKKASLIAFRQILQKILPAAYIFSNTVMTNLKKPFNTKQCPAGLSPRIIPLNLYGKPFGWGRIPTNSRKFTHFPHQENPP